MNVHPMLREDKVQSRYGGLSHPLALLVFKPVTSWVQKDVGRGTTGYLYMQLSYLFCSWVSSDKTETTPLINLKTNNMIFLDDFLRFISFRKSDTHYYS